MKGISKYRVYIYSAVMFGIIFLIIPFLPDYYTNLLGKFLSLSITAIGIAWLWGHMNILPLGQGIFFGIGAYTIAMHLKLKATPQGELPDFMLWSGLTELPWWWHPFNNLFFTILFAIFAPMILSAIFSLIVFRIGITGVYFALISQALVAVFEIVLVSSQAYTGGFNGLTDFGPFLTWQVTDSSFQKKLLYFVVLIVFIILLFSLKMKGSRIGKIVQAVKDNETRLRFLGYHTLYFKVFIFILSAVLASISGALFTFFNGSISPPLIGVISSIEMVLWVALAGRENFLMVILSVLGVNFAKDQISSLFPSFWLYIMGAAYIVVVLLSKKPCFLFNILRTYMYRGKYGSASGS